MRLGVQLAEGLAAAHERGIVHRDLKPGNLMITADGAVKILDFGLARLVRPTRDSNLTQSITAVWDVTSGTLPYMSPEQLRGLPGDTRSDIYAAGAVLYEMATGERPFPRDAGNGVDRRDSAHVAALAPSTHSPGVTSGLERVILKALEKEPELRYQSARELQVALEGVHSGLPAATVARPRPLVAVTLGVLVLLPWPESCWA